jgi:glutathione S-transferase
LSLILHELTGAEGRCFSPYCWRSAMALAHKGLAWESRRTGFAGIAGIGGGQRTVPVLDDGGTLVGDSWAIAEHLEARHPERPSLFGGEAGRAYALFVQHWTNTQVHPPIFRMIAADIHDRLEAADQPYFRESREQRLGRPLEAVQAEREALLPAFRAALAPLRMTLAAQTFLGGERPTYADYVPFGAFQWARVMSPFRLLADDDPLHAWFGRCLDLHGGVARKVPAYW